jgi:hypothetical protein
LCLIINVKGADMSDILNPVVTMTERNAEAWKQLAVEYRERRMLDWALMLEKRVSELDRDYRAYPWGRKDA